MYYVYLLKSVNSPEKNYIGYTENIEQRIKQHNSGQSRHTAKYGPWGLISYTYFSDKRKAKEYEAYLKTRSGRVFAQKHLW